MINAKQRTSFIFLMFVFACIRTSGPVLALDFPRPPDARRLAILRCDNLNVGILYERVGAGLNPQNEGLLAWFQILDGTLLDVAACYGGHHFNWFQQVVEPDGYGVRADGTPLTDPFVPAWDSDRSYDSVVGGPHFVRSGRIRVSRHVTTPLKNRCSAALLSLEHNGREGQN